MRGIAILILLNVSACATVQRSPGSCVTASTSAAHDTAAIRAAALTPPSQPARVVSPTVTIEADTALAMVGEAGSNVTTLVRVERQEGCWRSVGEVGQFIS